MNDLKTKEIQASYLSFFMIAISRSLNYLTSFILVFFLSPHDFGIVAIVMATMAIMNTLSSFGVDSALISFKGDEKELLDDGWTIELLKGFILASILVLIAPALSMFFNEPDLILLFYILSIVFILQGSKNIGLVSLRKNFYFKELFKCEITMAIVNTFVTLSVVYFYPEPIAILLGYMSGWLSYVICSYLVSSYRPKIIFRKKQFMSLFSYSKWILFTAQINTLIENSVNLFIGSYFGTSILGQFERADMFSRKTAIQVGEVVWKVGLPSLSIRSKNMKELTERYILLLRYCCFFIFPLMSLVAVVLPIIFTKNLSDEWIYFSDMLVLLTISAVLSLLITPAGILFQAIGKPRIGLKVAFSRLIIMLLSAYPLIVTYGQFGVIYTLLLGVISAAVISLFEVLKNLDINAKTHLKIVCEYLLPCSAFFLLTLFDYSTFLIVALIPCSVFLYLLLISIISNDFRSRVAFLYSTIQKRISGN